MTDASNFPPDVTAPPPKKWYQLSLTTQIFIGLIVGVILGYVAPKWGQAVYFLRDIFLNLIKSIIAPLIFSTIVVGIAGGGDIKKVGRMGAKSLLYFEIVTTLALFVGLLVVNVVKPGANVKLAIADPSSVAVQPAPNQPATVAPIPTPSVQPASVTPPATTYSDAAPTPTPAAKDANAQAVEKIGQNKPKTLTETIVHIFPASVVEAMVKGDVLQIVAFSVIFAFAVAAMKDRGQPILRACESLSQIMFKFTEYVMKFAPFGVGAAMAHTIGEQGLGILKNLGLLIGGLYIALILFSLAVLLPVALLFRIPLKQFLSAIREPFTIAFATTSSESALPKAMEQLQRIGVPKRIVSFVMPTGYSFNLDGTTLYLAMASVFVAQAVESTVPGFKFSIGQQITMMLTLMVTSKGVAAVPRASLVILLATLDSFLPKGYGAIGVAVIFGVDELMDMARTSINVLGNCLATAVVARWEGEFDDKRAALYGTPEELALATD